MALRSLSTRRRGASANIMWLGGMDWGGSKQQDFTNKADVLERGGGASWYIIDPRKSQCIGYWDGLTALALIFTALVTPYEVAFLPPATSALEPLFLANRVIDMIFVCDMLLNFFLMSEAASESMTHGIQWNTRPWPIAKAYLRGWFALDLLSTASGAFDYLPLIDTADKGAAGGGSDDGDVGGDLQRLRILRVLRTFRLIKLMRLVRASRLAKRWANRLAINYAQLTLFQSIAGLVPLSHWVACTWAAVGYTQVYLGTPITETWLGVKGFCWLDDDVTAAAAAAMGGGGSLSSVDAAGAPLYSCFEAWRVYAASLCARARRRTDTVGTCAPCCPVVDSPRAVSR